jgi:hypothetical protein
LYFNKLNYVATPRNVSIVLGAAAALALATGTASANRSISANPGGGITGTSNGLLTCTENGGATITSSLTLTGSLHRLSPKIIGLLAGVATGCRAALGEASFGVRAAITCELTLPWHIRYNGFEGTLPNITALRLILLNMSFRVRDLVGGMVFNCLYQGDQNARASGRAANEIDRNAVIEMTLNSTDCAGRTATLAGSFSIRPSQSLRLL